MKKTFVSLAALTLALSVCASGAMAAGMGRGANFVDASGDGVCDHYVSGGRGMGRGANFADADGDGVCDTYGSGGRGMGRGANFADDNGDGVCDHYAAGARPQDGTGRANGFGGGRGC